MLWFDYGRDRRFGKPIKNALAPAKTPKGKTVTRQNLSVRLWRAMLASVHPGGLA